MTAIGPDGPAIPDGFGRELSEFFGRSVEELWEWPECHLCGAERRSTIVCEEFARCPLEIVRCADCGFCYSRPRPTAVLSDLIRLPETRNALVDAGILPEARRVKTEALFDYRKQLHHDANYRHGLREIARHKPEGTVLDVGCAGGRFVQLAGEAGYRGIGVDIHEAAAGYGRDELGLDLRLSEPDRLPDDLPPIDVVALWNVIEHVAEPLQMLGSIREVMAPGALLLVDVPNFAFRLAQWRVTGVCHATGQRFFPYDHLNHFTQTTLARMLDMGGFEVLRFAVSHTDGGTGLKHDLRHSVMRGLFHATLGRVNWQHPLSCLARLADRA